MPQIAQIGEIYASQLFWLAIFFTLALVVVGYGMLPKIQSTIDARDGKIAADLKSAEAARQSADDLEENYRVAMEKARSEANRLAGEAKASAAKKTEAKMSRAEKSIATKLDQAAADIAAQRKAAMAELETVAAEAARDMVAKVSGLKVDAKAAKAAVAAEMAHG